LNITVLGFLVVGFGLLSAGPAYAQIEGNMQYRIESIDVVNNVTVKTERVLSVVRSRVGDFFDEAKADEDTVRIGRLPGVFEATWDRRVVGNRVRLRFIIVETFVVRSIEFQSVCEDADGPFEPGRLRFKAKTLRGQLRFGTYDYVNVFTVRAGVGDLEGFYLKKGFPLVRVTLAEGQLRWGKVIYKICEGPRVKIGAVKFRPLVEEDETTAGERKRLRLKNGTLRGGTKSDIKNWFFWPKYYSKELVDKDVIKLHKLYVSKGFLYNEIRYDLAPDLLDADVIREQRTRRTSKVNITFEIAEGPECLVEEGRIIFRFFRDGGLQYETGPSRYFEEQELLAQFRRLGPGKTYRKHLAESDRKRLLKFYREQGFVDAQVAESALLSVPPPETEKAHVPVEFRIYEGRRFRIGAVNIMGNEQTQDKVIRRILDEYAFLPGEPYNADVAPRQGRGELEDEMRMRLMAESVSVRPGREYGYDPIADVCTADVNVVVEEGKTGQWNWGAGVSTNRGFIGQIIYEQRNFDISDKPKNFSEFRSVFWPSDGPPQAYLGAGQTLRVALQPGTEVSEYSVVFTDPYFRDKPIIFDLHGRSWEWERESHDEERLKGYLAFEERFQKRHRGRWAKSIGFRVENVDIHSLDSDVPKEILDDKGGTFLVGIRLGVGQNLTDDRFNPGKGHIINVGYEPVFGDHTFGILSGTYRWYHTLREDLAERRTILVTKLHASTILGQAPTFEKFYAGGTGFYGMRGFDYRGVSTRGLQRNVVNPERKDPIGSDWIFLASTEVVMPLVGEELAALLFVDSGAIDSGDYRAAVGTGIQIQSPRWFGPVPMRFELAVPIMKDDDDDTEVFSFSVGRLF
jgi:outer membrane protein insertion porin family